MVDNESHLRFIRIALAEAEKCIPTPTAFCVGCVLVYNPSDTNPAVVISTGYSRELPGNTHAEANALTKLDSLSASDMAAISKQLASLKKSDILAQTDVYTTMEPCSIRTSGLPPCADALIAAKVKRCFIGVSEPDDFVTCEGAQRLKDAGIEIIWVKGLEEECLKVARRGH
ncbi:diaminohydroxyphosphoribosylamino-pyrimidine deaminase [Moniliophthora roreri MCA 2997]|uniref:Diaminohydroxyphosphoribosylamino-pyrimidine deaminase n=2 Tax=Moniliophthora roreri TaxID=221103 RepID=V2XPN0_MONRO|nr:diaminohydroxyphosphoribosylamino-pyrimidine deaminase [Moniliophthora roreri MCA 2997]KAI3610376.1 diaminohydroxyphosphoribosylamino-pyrimidine deaminase [Moniliophthora roreri]